jgi:hypothetical protein
MIDGDDVIMKSIMQEGRNLNLELAGMCLLYSADRYDETRQKMLDINLRMNLILDSMEVLHARMGL